MLSSQRLAVVFLKYPAPGRVKTRLAASVGDVEAAAIYTDLVKRTLAALPNHGSGVWLYGEPADQVAEIESWVDSLGSFAWQSHAKVVAQPPGDLGERLGAVFAGAFDESFRQVVAVGTDCPQLNRTHFLRAWDALEKSDVVIGPAMDGGYYLIGLRRPAPEIFRGIPWSSPDTLSATLAAASAGGLSVTMIETLRDVDSIADWRALWPLM